MRKRDRKGEREDRQTDHGQTLNKHTKTDAERVREGDEVINTHTYTYALTNRERKKDKKSKG